MKKLLLLSCIFFMAFVPSENTQQQDQKLFKEFLNEFELISLPYKFYNPSNRKNPMDKKRFRPLDTLKYQKFALSNEGRHSIDYYKRFETKDFHGVIFRYGVDDYFPVVVTYAKNGEKIDSKSLLISGASGGFSYFSSTGILHKNLDIFIADTLINCQFDAANNKIPNSDSLWLDTQKGKLLPNGTFQMDTVVHFEGKWKKRKLKNGK